MYTPVALDEKQRSYLAIKWLPWIRASRETHNNVLTGSLMDTMKASEVALSERVKTRLHNRCPDMNSSATSYLRLVPAAPL